MTRRLLAALCLTALAFVWTAQADSVKIDKDKVKTTGTADKDFNAEKLAIEQQQLKMEFREFTQQLLRLAQNLELSNKPENKEKAKMLREALERAAKDGVDTKFNQLIEILRSPKTINDLDALNKAEQFNDSLRKDLQTLLRILLSDNRAELLKAERLRMEKLLEQLKDVIRKQERVRAQTEIAKRDSKEIAKDQAEVGNDTKKLIGKGKDSANNEGKRGEAKDKGGKDGKDGHGEGKKDTVQDKVDGKTENGKSKDGENKDGKGEPKENKDAKDSKQGEAKDAKGGDGKQGEAKEGKSGGKEGKGKEGDKDSKAGEGKGEKDGKDGEGKEGQGKDSKGGDGKEGQGKDGKAGDGKEGQGKDGKAGEGKAGEAKDNKAGGNGKPGENKTNQGNKSGDRKPGEGKQGQPKDAKGGGKQGEGKTGKPGDGKQGEGKSGKPGDGKSGKPGDSKGKGDGKGEGKGQSKPGSGKPGQGQASQGKQGGQQGQGKGDQGGQQQPQPQQPPQDQAQARKKISDATEKQDDAKKDLDKGDNPKASDNQDKAIKDLKDAQKRLEELLRQIREEEIERLLAALQARCEEMLRIQKMVKDGTVDTDARLTALVKAIKDRATREKDTDYRAQYQKSQELAITEEDLVKLANISIRLIEEEGSAIAFAEVFKQVRNDMDKVAKRLKGVDVGAVTQTIEQDIIDTLEEMIKALKKARQENKNKKPSKPGQPGKPGDQDLIDLLAELKMIRSMQVRVNKRTVDYHKFYPGHEQAPDPVTIKDAKAREDLERVLDELKDLSERQENIKRITRDIGKGKNKTRD
ncbi:MAG: hypothetical protein HYS12_24365 [Planctomycetes bacterium]|nr:hypothetical protein [Planctomycetota bacterium]